MNLEHKHSWNRISSNQILFYSKQKGLCPTARQWQWTVWLIQRTHLSILSHMICLSRFPTGFTRNSWPPPRSQVQVPQFLNTTLTLTSGLLKILSFVWRVFSCTTYRSSWSESAVAARASAKAKQAGNDQDTDEVCDVTKVSWFRKYAGEFKVFSVRTREIIAGGCWWVWLCYACKEKAC